MKLVVRVRIRLCGGLLEVVICAGMQQLRHFVVSRQSVGE